MIQAAIPAAAPVRPGTNAAVPPVWLTAPAITPLLLAAEAAHQLAMILCVECGPTAAAAPEAAAPTKGNKPELVLPVPPAPLPNVSMIRAAPTSPRLPHPLPPTAPSTAAYSATLMSA